MTSDQIRSHQEAVNYLHSSCNKTMGYLRELNTIHLTIDYPERTVGNSESEYVLSLRKVSFHVQAITSWPVATDILHVMGPDIRAAGEQLEPLVVRSVYNGSSNGDLIRRRRFYAERDKRLAVFSHPTPQTLIQDRVIGGLGKADSIVCLYQLYVLLTGLGVDYGLGLSEIAVELDDPRLSKVVDVIKRLKADCTSFSSDAVFQFVE